MYGVRDSNSLGLERGKSVWFSITWQGTRLEILVRNRCVMHWRSTLHSQTSIWVVTNDRRVKRQWFVLIYFQFNRQQDWRNWSSIVEWSNQNKLRTYLSELERLKTKRIHDPAFTSVNCCGLCFSQIIHLGMIVSKFSGIHWRVIHHSLILSWQVHHKQTKKESGIQPNTFFVNRRNHW